MHLEMGKLMFWGHTKHYSILVSIMRNDLCHSVDSNPRRTLAKYTTQKKLRVTNTCAYKYKQRPKMVTTNDKIIIWWLTNRKHKNTFWLDTSLLPWWKKGMYPPKWCSHKWIIIVIQICSAHIYIHPAGRSMRGNRKTWIQTIYNDSKNNIMCRDTCTMQLQIYLCVLLTRMHFAHPTSVDLHCVGLWLSRVRRCGVSMRPFVQLHAFALFR